MNSSHENRVGDVERIALGIVAPDGRDGMRAHVEQFANAKIPFIFDPGQGLPLFSGPELLEMIDAATFLAVNDYEGRLLAERTGVPLDVLAGRVEAVIETLGGEGSRIRTGGRVLAISGRPARRRWSIRRAAATPIARASSTASRTAFEWEKTGRLAALLGAQKIASRGGQNHRSIASAIGELYHQSFGEYLW